MKNIVIIGGGTGTFTLLSGLRRFPTNNAVIVSTADDGGSTGRLRRELGVMPPGDIRHCLVGLSYTDKLIRDLFSYRFEKGSLAGHTVGNIIVSALELVSGDIETAIRESAKLLNVRGEVAPVTLFPTKLSATLESGKKIMGEHWIDEPRHNGHLRIMSLALAPSSPANPRALALLRKANAIIFGPGDLYTSTLPNLLVKGVVPAIKRSSAKKILITNLMTKYGQTNTFGASNFVEVLLSYLGVGGIDTVIVNTQKPPSFALRRYRKEKAGPVAADLAQIKRLGVKVVAHPLISRKIFQKSKSDKLKRSFLRHDPAKIAKIIWRLVQ
jgi:uncharacterized cofD-like protein